MQRREDAAEAVGSDSTLESDTAASQPTNSPTNLPTPNFPQHYVSMRITKPWAEWADIRDILVFSKFEWYISFPHKGIHRNNEHFHVFVPQLYPDDIPSRTTWIECIRKRFKVRLALKGNGSYSLKCCSNGLDKAIQYGSREGTTAFTNCDQATQWCKDAPAWVDLKEAVSTAPKETSSPKSKKRRGNEFGIPITCVNILHLAWTYRKMKMPTTNSLKEVVLRMLGDGYVFSPDIVRRGFPDFYNDCFADFCYVEKFDWTKTHHGDWWSKVSRKFQ